VYRHALSVKDDFVAFGSTTGNLYVSGDGGDTFTTLANNLPPIYSVRFD
jgi:glutamate synthase domain-containing protein 3